LCEEGKEGKARQGKGREGLKKAKDITSFGKIFLEVALNVFCGNPNAGNGKGLEELKPHFPPHLKNLIKNCCSTDPKL